MIYYKQLKRIWSRVNRDVGLGPDGDCWEWTHQTNEKGYGIVRIWERPIKVHRLFFEIFYEHPPDNLMVLHTCDNRKCCNPEHLKLGTAEDNTKDMLSKGREARGKERYPDRDGTSNPAAKLNWDKVYEIREKSKAGRSGHSLAKEYGVSNCAIYRIIKNKGWIEEERL
jgi:hypothetical protein